MANTARSTANQSAIIAHDTRIDGVENAVGSNTDSADANGSVYARIAANNQGLANANTQFNEFTASVNNRFAAVSDQIVDLKRNLRQENEQGVAVAIAMESAMLEHHEQGALNLNIGTYGNATAVGLSTVWRARGNPDMAYSFGIGYSHNETGRFGSRIGVKVSW